MIAIESPQRLPDLWTVAICVYSCAHFIGFSILFHLIQFTLKNDDFNINSETKSDEPSKNENDKLFFNFASSLSSKNCHTEKKPKNE